MLQTGGRTLDCSTFTVSVLARGMLSLSPPTVPGMGALSLPHLFPRSLWCPGGGDGQDPRQELGPLPATPLQTPTPRGCVHLGEGQGGLQGTKDRRQRGSFYKSM